MPKMTSQQSQIDRLSQLDRQKVTFTPDNLSPTCKEQIKETKKEQTEDIKGGNVYSGDDAILYEYAKPRAKKSVAAYIRRLKETGSAENVIKEYKRKNVSYPYSAKQTDLLREEREISREERTAPETCQAWLELGKKIGIKR